jgi:hypothetical protein
MSRYHNVLDASSLAKKYRQETGSDIILSLFQNKDCTIHVLNVTIPEVIGVFVRWELLYEIKKGKWKELKKLFINDIEDYQVVVHNITGRNIIETDNVWETSMPIKAGQAPQQVIICPQCKGEIRIPKEKQRVGSIDVLVVSVGLELKKIYGYNNAHLFTSDSHMQKVANRLNLRVFDPEAIMRLPF